MINNFEEIESKNEVTSASIKHPIITRLIDIATKKDFDELVVQKGRVLLLSLKKVEAVKCPEEFIGMLNGLWCDLQSQQKGLALCMFPVIS